MLETKRLADNGVESGGRIEGCGELREGWLC